MFKYHFTPFVLCYEGEDAAAAAAAAAAADKSKFTPEQQEVFNKAMAAEKRKYQQQISDLETKVKNTQLTEQARKELEEQLETVQSALRSKEEQAQHELNKQKNAAAAREKELVGSVDAWKNRYTDFAINSALMSAATMKPNSAYNPAQVVAILKPGSRLVEKMQDGKGTGDFDVLVKLQLPNSKGEMQVLELSPHEIVKRMKEATDLYGNLFESNASGGVGGTGSKKAGDADLATLAKNPAEYRRLRKEGKLPY